MERSKILIVDDSAVVQSYFNELLDPLRYKLLPATTLKETQTRMREHQDIDVAVVDLNLPDASQGVVVDNAIRRGIPVIVLSGVEDASIRERIVDKGIIDFIFKERKEDFEQVVHLIERLNLNKQEKILIVDDSKTFRDYIREMLEAHCFIVIEAEDGLQGLKLQQQHRDLKLIISDYEMPVMNGLEMIRNIRQTTDALSLPILVVSTRHEHDTACLKAGANDYIKKPFNRDEFLSRVYMNMTNKESMDTLDEYRQELEQYKKAIDQSTIVSKTDPQARITYVNDEFCRVSGYGRDELIGQTHNIVRHPDITDDFYKSLWQRLNHKKIWKGVIKNRAKDGKAYYVDSTIMPMFDVNGEVEEFISIRKDVTRLVEQKLIIKNQTTDYLTHLPNREKLLQDLKEVDNAALVLINIDGFNEINDFFGFDTGDKVIKELARRIQRFNSGVHELYKLPVDEFVLLGRNLRNSEVKTFVTDLVENLNKTPLNIEDNEIYISVTAGIYVGDAKHLVKADVAFKHAKKQGQSLISYDDLPNIDEQQKHNMEWVKKVRDALKEERFTAFYQPIVNNVDCSVEKCEALIRMMSPEGDPVSPYFFLDAAKKTKLYEKLTRVVFDRVKHLVKEEKISVSINLSILDVKNEPLVDYMLHEIEIGALGRHIVFEIVESEELENFDKVAAFMDRAKALGVRFSVDDFGTGYSNFHYLMQLKVDYIKIDGSIVKKVLEDPQSEVVVKTIVTFAQSLGIKTIAEFVASKEIYEKVKVLGVDYSQGYYFYEPLPESHLVCDVIDS